jgi:hypothetical protein
MATTTKTIKVAIPPIAFPERLFDPPVDEGSLDSSVGAGLSDPSVEEGEVDPSEGDVSEAV